MSSSTQIHTADGAEKIRKLFPQFRILIMGRANSGKTTILQRVCHTTENPTILGRDGKEISLSVLNPSKECGEHNIENQMEFKSNPGFIFHDSRGFESGSIEELVAVQKFVDTCSGKRRLRDQLHAIWYCIPTSDDRPITKAETDFFDKIGTGAVPVIVLFTKTDALYSPKIRQLICGGMKRQEAMQRGPQEAQDEFQRAIWPELGNKPHPPKDFVFLKEMQHPEADCTELIAKTAASLEGDDTLQQLFVSTQKKSIELCIKYAIQRWMKGQNQNVIQFAELAYFPHIWDRHQRRQQRQLDDWQDDRLLGPIKDDLDDRRLLLRLLQDDDDDQIDLDDVLSLDFWKTLGDIKTPLKKAIFYITMAIIAEHSFFLWEPKPSSSTMFFTNAFTVYTLADISTTIEHAVHAAFNDKQDVTTIIPDLIQIALDNRLSKHQQQAKNAVDIAIKDRQHL